jgi:trk system potassium uptake protein TrkH
LLVGFLVFSLVEWNTGFAHLNGPGKLGAAAFTSVTTRTAGFDTVSPARYSQAGKWMMMALMFVGASPSSTGGGIKTATLAVLLIVVVAMARGRNQAQVRKREIAETTRHRAFAVAALMAMAVFLLTFLLSVTERAPLDQVLFESFSALGTVGLSVGLTPLLSLTGRFIVTVAMFVGRVGPLTLALAIPPGKPSPVEYATEDVLVG